MKTPCPSCPDGNVWGANGPTGAVCPTCKGKAYVGGEMIQICVYCGKERPEDLYTPCCGEMHFEFVEVDDDC
jgi:hypothetical protein